MCDWPAWLAGVDCWPSYEAHSTTPSSDMQHVWVGCLAGNGVSKEAVDRVKAILKKEHEHHGAVRTPPARSDIKHSTLLQTHTLPLVTHAHTRTHTRLQSAAGS